METIHLNGPNVSITLVFGGVDLVYQGSYYQPKQGNTDKSRIATIDLHGLIQNGSVSGIKCHLGDECYLPLLPEPETSIVSRGDLLFQVTQEALEIFTLPECYIYLRQDPIKIKPSSNLVSFMDPMGSSSGVPNIV